jgi:hypothetical protein
VTTATLATSLALSSLLFLVNSQSQFFFNADRTITLAQTLKRETCAYEFVVWTTVSECIGDGSIETTYSYTTKNSTAFNPRKGHKNKREKIRERKKSINVFVWLVSLVLVESYSWSTASWSPQPSQLVCATVECPLA